MSEKTKIIDYTTKQFLKNGFYKVSMDQLASGMRISKKTIYKYFLSKTLLVENVIRVFQSKIKRDLEHIVENGDCLTQIRELSKYFTNLSLKINQKMLTDLTKHQPELWKQIDSFRTDIISNVWSTIINQGKSEKIIIDVPNEIIIGVVTSAIRGVINPIFLKKNSIDISEAFEVTFKIIISGILTEKGKIAFKKQEWETKNEIN